MITANTNWYPKISLMTMNTCEIGDTVGMEISIPATSSGTMIAMAMVTTMTMMESFEEHSKSPILDKQRSILF